MPVIKPVLLASLLEKEEAERLQDELESQFPGVSFSIKRHKVLAPTGELWMIHAARTKFPYKFETELIKEFTLNLLNTKNDNNNEVL